MDVNSLFTVIEDEIIARLAAQGITCVSYPLLHLTGIPMAELVLTGVGSDEIEAPYSAQHAYGISQVEYTLSYFDRLDDGDHAAYPRMRAAIVAIYTALASDVTIGHVCESSSLGRGRIVPVVTDSVPALMFEAPLVVVPHPNIG